MHETTHSASETSAVRHGLPVLHRPLAPSTPSESQGKPARIATAAELPSANFSLRRLRSTDTMGALDDSPAPVGQIFQEQMCMQRLLALFTHEIRWLRRSGAHQLDVSLRPDNETRIALHVVWHQGHFEAEARCQEGDYPLVNARWPELQYLLESQGLRLGPLAPPLARFEFKADRSANPPPLLPAPTVSA